MSAVADVLVLGGGPAGVVAARGLAALGLDVLLLTRRRRPAAFEGLAGRALDGLRHAGCVHALAAVGMEIRRDAEWNGAAFGGNREWITDRPRFDAALERDAAEAGVRVLNARAGHVECLADGWHVGVAGAPGAPGWRARFLVEARGRAAPRQPVLQGPPTTALARRYRLPAGRAAASAIDTFDAGWAWFASDGAEAVLQFFLDTAPALPGRSTLAAHHAALLGRVPALAARLAGAVPLGEVHARQAQTLLSDDLVSPSHLRLGDAAFAIDPLSGHGVFEAVGAGLAAVAVINTLLRAPPQAAAAMAFHRERVSGDGLRKARIGRDFYALERRWPQAPFWAARSRWPDAEPAHAPTAAGAARIVRRPVSRDGFIVEDAVVVTAEQPRGVWQVAGVPLVPLWQAWREAAGAAGFAAGYAGRLGVAPAAVHAALTWLRAHPPVADGD